MAEKPPPMEATPKRALESDDDEAPICPLCDRPIPKTAKQSVHHLTPKLKGGAKGPRVLLHHICHRAIHRHCSESELARRYNTIDLLKEHPDIAKFVSWVKKKDPSFYAPTYSRPRKKR